VAAFAPYAERARGGRFIAVGEVTAKEIERLYNVNYGNILVPESYYAAEIKQLLEGLPLFGKHVISPGAKARIHDMAEFFTGSGAVFEAPVTYETKAVIYDKDLVNNFLVDYSVDVVTFFSPSAVESFFEQADFPEGIRAAAIGATTAKSLSKRGIAAIVPEKPTAESLVELLKGKE
jgi:uroporphyrinogen-III synthase